MINTKAFFQGGKAGFILGAALLTLTNGCAVRVNEPSAGVYVAPPSAEVSIVAQDDYVYYPGYNVYYNTYRHQYAYMDGGAWVSRPAPRGVSVNVLLASPSVRMNFHDSPALHHAAIVQQYPKNWKARAQENSHQNDKRADSNRR